MRFVKYGDRSLQADVYRDVGEDAKNQHIPSRPIVQAGRLATENVLYYRPPHGGSAYLSLCGTDGTNWTPDPASAETTQGCKHRKVCSSTTSLRRVSRLDSALDVVLETCRPPIESGWCGDPPTRSSRDNGRLPVAQLSSCPLLVHRKRFLGC